MDSLKAPEIKDFKYHVDKFSDLSILRYRVPDLETLTLKQQELFYYLTKAALEGYDILYDQQGKYNLLVRRIFEEIYVTFNGDKSSNDFKEFEIYLKRVWVSNGIHHHYSKDKFVPGFSKEFLQKEIENLKESTFEKIGVAKEKVLEILIPLIFDPKMMSKGTNLVKGQDLVQTSAVNFYENVTQKEVEDYYNAMKKPNDTATPSFGINSKLIKENGKLVEKVYKIGDMYSKAIEKIVFWLEKAAKVSENDQQKKVIEKLISFYKTGSVQEYDEYSIEWVKDNTSFLDFLNGFVEVYADPLGLKGSWEGLVDFINLKATQRTTILSKNAKWFEDNSPADEKYKKKEVKGITAKVITTGIHSGDLYPTTAIGINLPNADWIRSTHGSKSVTLENITEAYEEASHGNGFREEFVWSQNEIDLINKYYFQTDNLHTDLHECLGHASGQLLPGITLDKLKAYGSCLEEGRADLFALYYMADKKMIELGLLQDPEAYKAEYYSYFMNGLLTQQCRIELGKEIEEAHMRNRQFICRWVLEKSKDDHAVEIKEKNGKHYVVINDYLKIKEYLGQLLAEVQRIKSEGDLEAAKNLIENYGVKLDPKIHEEILARYKKLNITPYKGFVNPKYEAVFDENGNFKQLKIDYSENYVDQHLRYAKEYSNLPTLN